MAPEEIEQLKTAVQAAITMGAPPAAMQPINDFITQHSGTEFSPFGPDETAREDLHGRPTPNPEPG